MQNSETKEQTPLEKFLALGRRVLSVPKAEIDNREKEWKKARKALKKRTT